MYWNLPDNERLVMALVLADNTHVARDFLKDLLTEKEMYLFAQKLKVACLLFDGISYTEIRKMTGLGSATIAEISKKLSDKKGGYNQILKKFNPHGKRYFE